ncbi:cytochrome c oxidase assembly protein [Sphingomonas lacunae]|uniref:Cytochrome c oxidase assembly protein CtaG n=1 Tax=Sphingomonas lacunae TaxID=2698828 RepID=A0A6M4AX83_9SPHN|nr:cytochrome c oxidase assembly protein [Sphingomonas lacunae]QJQ31561.1 cytochrome c oxidase assembly protein [Sphingomonas lacunae]
MQWINQLDRNIRTGLWVGMIAVAMTALGFAAVPLYRIFCQVTGFGGTTMRVTEEEASKFVVADGKTISVRFDSNVSGNLPWSFRPERQRDTISIGARDMMVFVARNDSDRPITGTATFNVTPTQAGPYFSKVQCFCFTEQRLEPGQEVRMPVIYYVDPKLLDDVDARDVKEITLSYTFYPVDEAGSGR